MPSTNGDSDQHSHDAETGPFAHATVNGVHTHAHSAYGEQGGDQTHEHTHSHVNDRGHAHDHGMAVPAMRAAATPVRSWSIPRPTSEQPFVTAAATQAMRADAAWLSAFTALPDEPITAAGRMRGARWGIEETDGEYRILTAAGVPWPGQAAPANSYVQALEELAVQLAADTDSRPVLAQRWTSAMSFENVPTGDGRTISTGATQFRPTPLPLMLQTETAPGHMTALLAGSIDTTGMMGTTAQGSGDFDDSPVGQQFLDIINARGKFGVSIDVAEADGQAVCATHGEPSYDTCDEDCDIQMIFSMIRIMGLTGTPFPAFENAYIELASPNAAQAASGAATSPETAPLYPHGVTPPDMVPVPDVAPVGASGAASQFARPGVAVNGVRPVIADDPAFQADPDCVECGQGPIAQAEAIISGATAADTGGTGGDVIRAAAMVDQTGGPLPPASWFDDPQFAPGDGRTFAQPDGQHLCPLTVSEPDPATGLRRVYGHMAGWKTCHTGIPGTCTTAPHSSTNYAAFNLRPQMTAEGVPVTVGHLTMGVGHAATTGRMTIRNVQDHYDGGPGAIRMALVHMGEDAHGPWFSGYVNPNATPEQIEAFKSCSVSGDWREVWRGKGLELVACLAGVTVPGFPISSQAAIAASAALTAAGVATISEYPSWAVDGGTLVALTAAGVVHQPEPWERALAPIAARLDKAETLLRQHGLTIDAITPLAASAMLDGPDLAGPAEIVRPTVMTPEEIKARELLGQIEP